MYTKTISQLLIACLTAIVIPASSTAASPSLRRRLEDELTPVPSSSPSTKPSDSPSNTPSSLPTQGTLPPTPQPTQDPTLAPSDMPTAVSPTVGPTEVPSVSPTTMPSTSPSIAPSTTPTVAPTATEASPSPSSSPSEMPSNTEASPSPSSAPSQMPSNSPSSFPSASPSMASNSTASPTTLSPSAYPSASMSPSTSTAPTAYPTASMSPSVSPSAAATNDTTTSECDTCSDELEFKCNWNALVYDGTVGAVIPPLMNSTGSCGLPEPTITYTAFCEMCDGRACPIDEWSYETNAANEFIIHKAPVFSIIWFTGSYDNGCRVREFTCDAIESQIGSGEQMYGQPDSPKEVNQVDASEAGWYQEISDYAGGDTVVSFLMLTGRGHKDPTLGVQVGVVEVTVKECTETTAASTSDWSMLGTDEFCILEDWSRRWVHVGSDYPRDENGDVSFAPELHNTGCCVAGENCIVSVRSMMESASCQVPGECFPENRR